MAYRANTSFLINATPAQITLYNAIATACDASMTTMLAGINTALGPAGTRVANAEEVVRAYLRDSGISQL